MRQNSNAVIGRRVLFKAIKTRRNNCTTLRHAEENMLRIDLRPFEPVRVVEGARVNADNVRKAFKAESYFSSAGRAEMDMNLLAAPL